MKIKLGPVSASLVPNCKHCLQHPSRKKLRVCFGTSLWGRVMHATLYMFTSFLIHDTEQRTDFNNGMGQCSFIMGNISVKIVKWESYKQFSIHCQTQLTKAKHGSTHASPEGIRVRERTQTQKLSFTRIVVVKERQTDSNWDRDLMCSIK